MQLIGVYMYNAVRDIIEGKVKLEDVHSLVYINEGVNNHHEIVEQAVSFHEEYYNGEYDSFSINLILTYFFENNRILFFETDKQREEFIIDKRVFYPRPVEEEISREPVWVIRRN